MLIAEADPLRTFKAGQPHALRVMDIAFVGHHERPDHQYGDDAKLILDARDRDRDRARLGELDRVGHEVGQHLFQSDGIAQDARDRVGDLAGGDRQPFSRLSTP